MTPAIATYMPVRSAGWKALITCALFCFCATDYILAAPAPSEQANQRESSGDTERFDGPAELPRVYMNTALSDTPSPGKIHKVNAGSDLQRTVNDAACGDVIELEEGASFQGPIRLPPKHCDDGHWIVIRTGASDEKLPREGTRVSPCYAGVESLPARPAFHCSEVKNVLAKVLAVGKGGHGAIEFGNGANHYRFIGLEITREAPGIGFYNLVRPENNAAADHIIFDRVWVHGTAHDETTRGIFLSGTRFVAVVDSYFSDFHCVAVTGVCVDSQAIAGGAGDLPMGPFKIVNNFLEASGENIIFGGGGGAMTPADIEIRRNRLFKPTIWMPGSPGFVGGASGKPFITKNLFEIKNAQRVLFEGNVLDNSWGGTGQTGFAIVITPRNAGSQCPLCRVTDITLRYCKVRHMASGVQIVNAPSDTGGIATAGERYSIHDLVFEDIDGETYKGFGVFALIASNAPQLRDVTIDHVTAFPRRVLFNIGVPRDKPLPERFVFTNNIFSATEREVTSTGGGKQNCTFGALQLGPEAVFKACFKSVRFTHNAIIAPKAAWPRDNSFPKDENSVGFVEFNHGIGGNYRLCADKGESPSCKKGSPYAHAGTDRRDLGANIDALEAALKGVE